MARCLVSAGMSGRVVPHRCEHCVVIPELPNYDLVSLPLLTQSHNFGFQQFDLLYEVNILVTLHFLQLSLHGFEHGVVFLYFETELLIHPLNF